MTLPGRVPFLCQFMLAKCVHPVAFPQINAEDDTAAGPGERIGEGHHFQLLHKQQRNGDIGDPQDAPAKQHHHHGHGGAACATHDGSNAMG